MKRKIFLTISIILGALSLIFLGLALYWLHVSMWSDPSYLIYQIPFAIASIILMVIALIFYNSTGLEGAPIIAVNISFPLVVLLAIPAFYGGERLAYSLYTSFSPEKWLVVEDRYKVDMARSFLGQYGVEGMTVEEIVPLLGEPDEEGLVYGEDYPYCYKYDCGMVNYPYRYWLTLYTAEGDRTLEILHHTLLSTTNPDESLS